MPKLSEVMGTAPPPATAPRLRLSDVMGASAAPEGGREPAPTPAAPTVPAAPARAREPLQLGGKDSPVVDFGAIVDGLLPGGQGQRNRDKIGAPFEAARNPTSPTGSTMQALPEPGLLDKLGEAITGAGINDGVDGNGSLLDAVFGAGGVIGDALTPDALQRGMIRGKQGLAIGMEEAGIGPRSALGPGDDAARLHSELADLALQAEAYPMPANRQAALRGISQAEGFGGVVRYMMDNPGDSSAAVGDVILESLGVAAPNLVITGVGSAAGPGGTGAAAGTTSFVTEYTQTIINKVLEAGGDPTDPATWQRSLSDPNFMAGARESALARGVPIATFDALTAGFAGTFLRGMRGVPQVLAGSAKEAGMQAGGGALGEFAAQVNDDGVIKPGEIFLEGVAEIPGGAVEVAGNVMHAPAPLTIETTPTPDLRASILDPKTAPDQRLAAALELMQRGERVDLPGAEPDAPGAARAATAAAAATVDAPPAPIAAPGADAGVPAPLGAAIDALIKEGLVAPNSGAPAAPVSQESQVSQPASLEALLADPEFAATLDALSAPAGAPSEASAPAASSGGLAPAPGEVVSELPIVPKRKARTKKLSEVVAAAPAPVSQDSQPLADAVPAEQPAPAPVEKPVEAPLAAAVPDDDTPDAPVEIRYGKPRVPQRPGAMPKAQATAEHYAPAELVEPAAEEVAAGDGAVHADPGEIPEAATPAVVVEAIKKSAKNTPRGLKQAQQHLLGMIDTAIASAPNTPALTPPVRTNYQRRGDFESAMKAYQAALKDAPKVEFDVPGDGKFKVTNSQAALQDFRAKVEKSPGFREKQARPSGPQLPSMRATPAERAKIMAEAEDVDPDAPLESRTTRQAKRVASNAPPAKSDVVQEGEDKALIGRARGEVRRLRTEPKIQAIEKALGPAARHVNVITGRDELPAALRDSLPENDRTEAVFDPKTGKVYLFAADDMTGRRAAWVAAHEVAGHLGLRGLVAQYAHDELRDAGAVLTSALDAAAQNPTVAAVAKAIAHENPDYDTARATEEALSELAAAQRTGDFDAIEQRYGVTVPAAQRPGLRGAIVRVMQAIADFLRAVFGRGGFSDREVFQLLEDAWQIAQDSAPTTGRGRAAESRDAPTFYSAAYRAVANGKGAPKKAGAAAWKGWLDGAVRRGEIKQSERDWLGIDAFLDRHEKEFGAIERADIEDFITQNEVHVEDVILKTGRGPEGMPAISDELNVFLDDVGEDVDSMNNAADWDRVADGLEDMAHDYEADDDMPAAQENLRMSAEARRIARTIREGGDGSARFSQYTLPGGENYRELLLTLPDDSRFTERDVTQAVDRGDGLWYVAIDRSNFYWSAVVAAGNREEAVRGALAKAPDSGNGKFKSGHFEQPNVVVHVRFNERTDADGKRVLFIEEIQSDWHQKGRRKGYKTGNEAKNFAEFMDLRGREADTTRLFALQGDGTPEDRALWNEWRAEAERYAGGTPNAPFKGTDEWAMVAFKRAARWAVDNGFDRIAWTTGAQQNARYDLAQKVDNISVVPSPSGTRSIRIEPISGSAVVFDVAADGTVSRSTQQQFDGKALDEVVGKDMADKIMASESEHTFSGGELSIGGEGMRGFYDKILPSSVKKWAKPFDAAPIKATIGTGQSSSMPPAFGPMQAVDREAYQGADDFPNGDEPQVGNATINIEGDATPVMFILAGEGVDVIPNDDPESGHHVMWEDLGMFRAPYSADDAIKVFQKGWVAPEGARGNLWDNLFPDGTDASAQVGGGNVVHAIDITPKMRDAVKAGQPLFSRKAPRKPDLRKLDVEPIIPKAGLIRQEIDGIKKAIKGILHPERPRNPRPIVERVNSVRAVLFDSMMSRAHVLRAKYPRSRALPQLLDLVFTTPGTGRPVYLTLTEGIQQRYAQFSNRWANALASNGLANMTKADNVKLRNALLGIGGTPAPNIAAAAEQLRALMDVMATDARTAGLDFGEVTDIGYLTRIYDEARIVENAASEKRFLTDARTLFRDHEFPAEVGAARGIVYERERLVRFVEIARQVRKPIVQAGLANIAKSLQEYRLTSDLSHVKAVEAEIRNIYNDVAEGFADQRAAAWLHGIKTPNMADGFATVQSPGAPMLKERVLSGAADTVMSAWMITDVGEVLDTYGRAMARKIEFAERFGPTGLKVQELLDKMISEGVSTFDAGVAGRMAATMAGQMKIPTPTEFSAAADWVHAIGYVAMLDKAVISSLVEPVAASIRTGDVRNLLAPLIQAARSVRRVARVPTKRGREVEALAKAIGIVTNAGAEAVLMNQLGGDYALSPKPASLLSRFFSVTLLNRITQSQRIFETGVADNYLRSLARSVTGTRGRGLERVFDWSPTQARAELADLGIADADGFAAWMLGQNGTPDSYALFDPNGRPTPHGSRYMAAVHRFVDQVIQNPNAGMRPETASAGPIGRLMYGIMAFSYSFYENLVKGSVRRIAGIAEREGWTSAVKATALRTIPAFFSLYLAQTLISTLRELILNPERWEDMEDDERARKLALLGLTRSFGLGAADPIIQYLTGIKYGRSAAETVVGAAPGLFLGALDKITGLGSDRNSPNTSTTEYRAAQGIYEAMLQPALNAAMSSVGVGPLSKALASAVVILGGDAMKAPFAELFGVTPEKETELDRQYTAAKKELAALQAELEGRVALLPKDQWAAEFEELKAEYPDLLAGARLDVYADNAPNRRLGRAGVPKTDSGGGLAIKLEGPEGGSVLGDLEGYNRWRRENGRNVPYTTKGVNDRIGDLNTALTTLREDRDIALVELEKLGPFTEAVANLPETDDLSVPATNAQRQAVIDELEEERRDLKRQAVELIDRGTTRGTEP